MRQEPKDYYQILGVSEDAPSDEIKKAFRHLAIKYHPDRNEGDLKYEERFKTITEAYGVLIDPKKRRKYDLHRTAWKSGKQTNSYDFRYSQEDIFKDVFKNARYRKIFDELNREFSQSGYRSGPNFFQNMFFGGGGGFLRLLWLLPGPFGRIGQFFRIIQMVGSSLIFLNRIMKPRAETGSPKTPFLNNIKRYFKISNSIPSSPLDIDMLINIPSSEAESGTHKKITYKINEIPENLVLKIPPGIRSGQTLRLKKKGKRDGEKRGDLLLSVQVK